MSAVKVCLGKTVVQEPLYFSCPFNFEDVFWDVALYSVVKFTDVLEVFTASIMRVITLMLEAVSISERSVNFYKTTQHNIPEDINLHSDHLENVGSHPFNLLLCLNQISAAQTG
jgi:hypothetical protein